MYEVALGHSTLSARYHALRRCDLFCFGTVILVLMLSGGATTLNHKMDGVLELWKYLRCPPRLC